MEARRAGWSVTGWSVTGLSVTGWSVHLWASLALVLAVLATFSPALEASFVNWDDEANVVDNRHFRGLGAVQHEWMWTRPHGGPYMPLTWLSMAIDHELWGLSEGLDAPEAPRYHATNVLLHALTALAVYLLALRLFARARPGRDRLDRTLAALLAALLFAVHPLRVESVAWVTERRDVLSGVFFVLAAAAYVRASPEGPPELRPGPALAACGAAALAVAAFFLAVQLGDEALSLRAGPAGLALALILLAASVLLVPRASRYPHAPGRTAAFALCCLWLLLALLSKALGVALPIALLVLDAWPLRRWRAGDGWRTLAALAVEKTPLVALSLVFGALALWGQSRYPEALALLEYHGLLERVAQAFYGLWFYPSRTLVPLGLIPLVELPGDLSLASPRYLLAALAVLAGAAALWVFRRRAPAAACAFAVFALLVAPVLGLTQAGSQLVADRYSYLPCLSLALLLGGAWLLWRERARSRIALAAAAAAVLALGGLTWRQTRVWRDSEQLWNHMIAVAPGSGLPHMLLGMLHYRRAQEVGQRERALEGMAEARRHFEDGLRLDPEPVPVYLNGYGALLLDLGQTERAIEVIAAFLRQRPDDHVGLVNLAVALRQAGRPAAGLPYLERAVEVKPDYTKAWLQLAETQDALGNEAAAVRAYEQVLARWPNYGRAKRRLRELRGDG